MPYRQMACRWFCFYIETLLPISVKGGPNHLLHATAQKILNASAGRKAQAARAGCTTSAKMLSNRRGHQTPSACCSARDAFWPDFSSAQGGPFKSGLAVRCENQRLQATSFRRTWWQVKWRKVSVWSDVTILAIVWCSSRGPSRSFVLGMPTMQMTGWCSA